MHSAGHVLSTYWGIYRPCGKELKVFADRGAEKRTIEENYFVPCRTIRRFTPSNLQYYLIGLQDFQQMMTSNVRAVTARKSLELGGICSDLAEKDRRAWPRRGERRGSQERPLPAASFQQAFCSPAKGSNSEASGSTLPRDQICCNCVRLERKPTTSNFSLVQFSNNYLFIFGNLAWISLGYYTGMQVILVLWCIISWDL